MNEIEYQTKTPMLFYHIFECKCVCVCVCIVFLLEFLIFIRTSSSLDVLSLTFCTDPLCE